MTKLIATLLLLSFINVSWAKNEASDLIANVSQHLVKIKVTLPTGHGLGSGVVVAKNKVVTNCHVVADATSVDLHIGNQRLTVSGLIPDWQHDLCILVVDGLNSPVAQLGNSEQLRYEQPLYAMGFAGDTKKPHVSFGAVKGLYPMDDSVIVRASNAFNVGDSGGGVFDDTGHLVAIIDVKSPGKTPNYYNISVAWVKKLMQQPVQNMVNTHQGTSPFWATERKNWPYFMQVVHPLKTKNWAKLNQLANQWALAEPNTIEAHFYQGVAAFKMHDLTKAQHHLHYVVDHNKLHTGAVYLLSLIENQNGLALKANLHQNKS